MVVLRIECDKVYRISQDTFVSFIIPYHFYTVKETWFGRKTHLFYSESTSYTFAAKIHSIVLMGIVASTFTIDILK